MEETNEGCAKRVFGNHGGITRRGATEICGACYVLQSPLVHATVERGGGRVRVRPEGNHHNPLSCGRIQEYTGLD
ncbi:hypothetical protein J1N35_010820 [Gossypium stocksii]|uniref:Uncharacterized protein n=1 Tax=Gossypium stocksii TaxID=47602 RepID=A0A9D4AAX2_9ROSI|nr:hypothetical protein J1N35_010820 [Gossypium stocksii]